MMTTSSHWGENNFWSGSPHHLAAEQAKVMWTSSTGIRRPELPLNQFLEGKKPVYHSETIINNETIIRSQDIKIVHETAL